MGLEEAWTKEDMMVAIKQGWNIWDVDGTARIQRIDEPESAAYDWGLLTDDDYNRKGVLKKKVVCPIPQLDSDTHAMRIVRENAKKGDYTALLARFLHGRKWNSSVQLPADLVRSTITV